MNLGVSMHNCGCTKTPGVTTGRRLDTCTSPAWWCLARLPVLECTNHDVSVVKRESIYKQ